MEIKIPLSVEDRLAETEQVMHRFQVRFPKPEEMPMLHAAFQPMIDVPITADETVEQVHGITGQCIFVLDERSVKPRKLAASMLLIQLSETGAIRLKTGEPLGHCIDVEWVCKPSEVPRALLVWGLLGKNAWYSGRILAFSLALAEGVYSDIPIYTYAATRDGERIMDSVGFRPTHIPGLSQLDLNFKRGKRHA